MNIFKFILVFLTFLPLNSISQNLAGLYKCQDLHINFHNDTAEFVIAGEGGVIFIYKGCGKYKVINDFLVIDTKEYCKEKSKYKKIENNSDTTTIKILDSDNDFDIENYASVTFIDRYRKELNYLRTNSDGIITVINDFNIDYFYVLAAGYEQIKVKYEPKIDYIFSMVDGEFIENETLAFHLDILDNHTFELYQLGTVKKSNKNLLRQLKKSKRRREMHKRRYPYRIDKFIKE